MVFSGVLDWSPHTQHHVKRNIWSIKSRPLSLSMCEDRPCVVKSHILLEVTLLTQKRWIAGQIGLLSRSEGNPSRRRKLQIQIKTALMKIPQCSIPYRIVRRAGKQGTRPSVTGHAEVEKCATGSDGLSPFSTTSGTRTLNMTANKSNSKNNINNNSNNNKNSRKSSNNIQFNNIRIATINVRTAQDDIKLAAIVKPQAILVLIF